MQWADPIQGALTNIYNYQYRFINQKKEALSRNDLSCNSDRQTFTANGLQKARISFTDRSK